MNNFLTKKVDEKTTKIERKVKKIGKKVRFYGIIGAIMLGLGLAFYLFYKVSVFYDNNKVIFQSPIIIKLQTPIRIEKRSSVTLKRPLIAPKLNDKVVQATPVPKTEKEIVLAQKHGEILWKIYGLESTWGKADGCRLTGNGWGGFGVMNEGQVVCYESFQRATERAEYWLSKMKPDEDLASALCLWNTGIRQPMCNYSISYNNL